LSFGNNIVYQYHQRGKLRQSAVVFLEWGCAPYTAELRRRKAPSGETTGRWFLQGCYVPRKWSTIHSPQTNAAGFQIYSCGTSNPWPL